MGSTRDCSFMDRELAKMTRDPQRRGVVQLRGPAWRPWPVQAVPLVRTGALPVAGELCPSHVRCTARRTRSESTAVPVPLTVTTPAGRGGPSRRSKTPHLDDSEPGILEAKLGIRVQDAGHHPHCISSLASI